ncbi:hypothetical protein Tco_0756621 [Tanacetum coccineum]
MLKYLEIRNICPKVPSKAFDEPPTKEEALSFIRELGHTVEIKYITNVIVDHLHQPWRTFASIINKCLCGESADMTTCHMLILLLMGSYVVKDGNESTPGDMIWYKEIVPQLTLGSKLVATDSPAFEALRRAHVNEILDAIRGRGMNNLLADRLKVNTNVSMLAVSLGWSLSNHYWCRYPECKSYGKTSRGHNLFPLFSLH